MAIMETCLQVWLENLICILEYFKFVLIVLDWEIIDIINYSSKSIQGKCAAEQCSWSFHKTACRQCAEDPDILLNSIMLK